MKIVELKNVTKVAQTIYAADGTSAIVPPESVVRVSDKFLWALDNTTIRRISFNSEPSPVREPEEHVYTAVVEHRE